jgi:iron complex outermembrane receptor protein
VTRPYQDNTYDGALAEIALKTAAGDLTIIPAVRRGVLDFNFNGPSFQSGLINEDNVQRSLEVRFQGKRAGIFDWLVGGYYFHEDVSGQESYNQYVVNALLDFDSKTQSTAVFGRLVANLSDDVRLVLGDRYTRDEKQLDGSAPNIIQGCGSFPPAAPFTAPFTPCFGSPSLPVVQTFGQDIANGTVAATPFTPKPFGPNPNAYTFWTPLTSSADPVFNKDTYRLAAEWDVAPASLLYASYETGYRSGGFSLAAGHTVFQPETLNAWTLGSKNRFLADRLQLNVEAFYWKYANQQVSHFGIDATGNQGYFTENIGRSTIKGIDVDGEYLLAEHTLATFTAQYLNAIINQFTFTQLEQGAGAVTGCAKTRIQDPQVGLEYVIDCAGKPDYFSPKWSLNLGLQQIVPAGALNVVVAADTAYTSQQYNGFDFLPEEINAAHWTSNASVTVKQPKDRWSVGVYVRNIEGTRYKTSTQFSPASGSVIDSWYSAPRTFGVRLGMRF